MKKKLLLPGFLLATFFANAQNVGINNPFPQFPLSFNGNLGDKISLWTDGTPTHYGLGIQSQLLQIYSKTSLDNIAFGFGSSNSFNERMRIINTGEYGMELNGRILLRNGTFPVDPNYSPGIWLTKADNSGLLGFIGTQNNQNLGFFGGTAGWGLTYDAVDSEVGIGITNPVYPLHVTGNVYRTGFFVNTATSVDYYGLAGICATTPGYGGGLAGYGGHIGVYGESAIAGTGSRIGIFGFGASGSNGVNYGVYGQAQAGVLAYGIFGTASGASTSNWAGYFSGNVYSSGTYTPSDSKLKNDIEPLRSALVIINQLNPSVYTYKTNEFQQMHLPEGLHYGLIADEVLQVMSGAVKKVVQPAQYENHNELSGKKLSDEVVFNAVNYTEMIPVLIAAVKEQQLIINSQQKQIDELKKMVDKLLIKGNN